MQPVNHIQREPECIESENYFSRSPRFHREINDATIVIDPPPAPPKLDSVPLALMLGPSITMGMTSVSTGILTLSNVMANEDYAIKQAYVFHNGNVSTKEKIAYLPIYMLMFVQKVNEPEEIIYKIDLDVLR